MQRRESRDTLAAAMAVAAAGRSVGSLQGRFTTCLAHAFARPATGESSSSRCSCSSSARCRRPPTRRRSSCRSRRTGRNTGLITAQRRLVGRSRRRRLPRRRPGGRARRRPADDHRGRQRHADRRERQPDRPQHFHDRRRLRVRDRQPGRRAPGLGHRPTRRTSCWRSTRPTRPTSPSRTSSVTSTARPTTRSSRSRSSTASARRAPTRTSRAATSPTRPRAGQATQVTPVSVLLPARGREPVARPGARDHRGRRGQRRVGRHRRHLGHRRRRAAAGHGPVRHGHVARTTAAPTWPGTRTSTITFSEPVAVGAATFAISCTTSGAHTFALSGGPTIYTLNPDTDFANDETCTVTVDDAGVSDTDTQRSAGPDGRRLRVQLQHGRPDASGSTRSRAPATSRRSTGRRVSAVPGVVTAKTLERPLHPGRHRRRQRGHLGRHLRLHRLVVAGRGRRARCW